MNEKLTEDPSFGEWLRQRRRLLDLTQQELADQVGCARITLRRIESGTLKPSKELAQILLEKLDTPPIDREALLRFARGVSGSPEHETQFLISKPITNLPASLTLFIGREKETEEVIDLLGQNRLVSLTGVGGIGKTRLALQVGQRLLNDYPNGVWFIALDALSDPALVTQTVAFVFDIREGSSDQSLLERLTYSLRQKTSLLIMDNCEHLRDACARLSKLLLTNCPTVKILVTSREVLNIEGEATYYLPSLSTPEGSPTLETLTNYESIRLFEERASLAFSSFRLTKENGQSILEICRRVDGIPLAIELVAAYMDTLQAKEILKQLDQSFSLLAAGNRSTLPRHQTMQASLDWSWGLLNEEEQVFLRELSVFAGGWTLESAQAIWEGNALALLKTLVKKSLVLVDQKSEAGTRYRFHEIVRQYMHQRLQESTIEEKIRTRHLRYFLQLSKQAVIALQGPTQVEWMSCLNDERDNIRIALEWAAKTDVEAGLYISSSLHRYWESFDMREGSFWLAEFIQKPESKTYPLAKAKAFLVYGRILGWMQQLTQARSAALACLELFRNCSDRQGEIDGLLLLGYVGVVTDEPKQLRQQALALAQALGDVWRQASALFQLGWSFSGDQRFVYWEQALTLMYQTGDWSSLATLLSFLGNFYILNGNFELAQKRLEEAARLNDQLNDKGREAYLLHVRGRMAMIQGDYDQAHAYLQKVLGIAEELGAHMNSLWCRSNLGYIALHENNLSEACDIFAETVQDFQKDKDTIGVVFTLEGMAGLYAAMDKTTIAARLIGWADATREKISDTRPLLEQAGVDKIIAACLTKMSEAAFSDDYDQGQKMTLDDAVAYALEEK
jgi:predicted ATPase/DNA-binding XRE family transcriptional regulator